MASNQFEVNLQVLKRLKSVSLVADGRTLFTFALCEAFKVEKGTLTVFGESKLRERDGLIGMSGAYFHPALLYASSCDEVVDAWDWIGKEVGDSFYQMSQFLTGAFVLRAIKTGVNFAVTAPLGVTVKLHKLSKFIDIKPKVKELKQFVKGNVKSWNRDQTLQWYDNVDTMTRFLCNLDAEFEFALFSLECGLSVRLAKHPDIFLEEIPVDIKNPSWGHSLPTRNYTRKIIEHAEDAFQEQHAKLVGLSIGVALIMFGIAKKRASKNRIGREEFCIALKKGLILAKDERKPVLLFYHDLWTGDVQAITKTIEDLKEDFGGF
ncbi:MAG: hypothetical protein SYNGOMJ08_00271 [Candidatus Syntrophoarchaeum sp. GoM_oil]|nr:MAG: hypothetical protein SYNGOMJ08_00271 [Candidatus Syntrophoarchaeum sp. GoM_oil]